MPKLKKMIDKQRGGQGNLGKMIGKKRGNLGKMINRSPAHEGRHGGDSIKYHIGMGDDSRMRGRKHSALGEYSQAEAHARGLGYRPSGKDAYRKGRAEAAAQRGDVDMTLKIQTKRMSELGAKSGSIISKYKEKTARRRRRAGVFMGGTSY